MTIGFVVHNLNVYIYLLCGYDDITKSNNTNGLLGMRADATSGSLCVSVCHCAIGICTVCIREFNFDTNELISNKMCSMDLWLCATID